MKTLMRKASVFAAALFLAVVLTSAVESPRYAYARCGTGVTTQIWSELNNRQTSDTVGGKTSETQDISSRSKHHSNNGTDSTSDTTLHINPDGSSHEHDEFHATDQGIGGNECYPEMEGKPWKGDVTNDDDKDPKGNRKRHHEEIIEKNGKCEKTIRDWEWNTKGELIKDTGWVSTDIPCSKYNLEVLYKGSIDVTHSIITYGPNIAEVHLEDKGNSYAGKFESVFDAKMTGKCDGFGTFPVSYDVTATKEDDFGEMDFIVKETKGKSAVVSCEGKSGMDTELTKTKTYTFKLTAEDGASTTFTIPPGYITLTFTLKTK
jgi:hypothetical protein